MTTWAHFPGSLPVVDEAGGSPIGQLQAMRQIEELSYVDLIANKGGI